MDCSRARSRDPIEWMETCPEFSWPLAERLREWILEWEPDLSESIKWNMLCFSARKLVCGISACQRHLSLTFFRGGELPDPQKLFNQRGREGVIMSIRATSLDGIDPRALRRLLRAAVMLDADPVVPPAKSMRPPPEIPDYLRDALATHASARAGWARLAMTYQREYISWLSSARRPETRAKRLAETLAAVAENLKWVDRRRVDVRSKKRAPTDRRRSGK